MYSLAVFLHVLEGVEKTDLCICSCSGLPTAHMHALSMWGSGC